MFQQFSQERVVLAIERAGALAKSGCVVVKVSKPEQDLRFDVPERIASDGSVLEPLDENFVRRLVTELRDKGIRGIGISYLNSFRNPSS